jgi:acetyl-CoA carboxylase biotin carboxyl carrier protein
MHSIKLEAITRIIESFGKSGADEVEIVEGTLRIRLRRHGGAPAADAPSVEGPAMEVEKPAPDASVSSVPAPMHGVFHRAAAPGAEPFVSIGSKVHAGQQLCILEAMKVFNALPSPRAGTVVAIHAENGADVMAGQSLFTIEPASSGA